jgi:glutamyl endopeptidase
MFQMTKTYASSHDNRNLRRVMVAAAWILLILMFFFLGTAPSAYAQEPGDSTRERQVLYKSDNRQLADTTKFPFSAVVLLRSTFPNGAQFSCSGALIGPNKVLTAEHCIYDSTYGGHATSVEVLPGYANNYTSCHKTSVVSFSHGSHDGCHGGAKCDIAVLTLRESLGCNTGWFGFKEFSLPDLRQVYLAGYPSDRNDGERMYYVGAGAEHLHGGGFHNLLSYQEWTAEGMSGGPIFTPDYYIVGVHTNGGTYANYGVALCNQLAAQIRAWKFQ